MNKKMLDLYSDYLLASGGGQVTATGLSNLLDGAVSHDSVTRFLKGEGQPPTARGVVDDGQTAGSSGGDR